MWPSSEMSALNLSTIFFTRLCEETGKQKHKDMVLYNREGWMVSQDKENQIPRKRQTVRNKQTEWSPPPESSLKAHPGTLFLYFYPLGLISRKKIPLFMFCFWTIEFVVLFYCDSRELTVPGHCTEAALFNATWFLHGYLEDTGRPLYSLQNRSLSALGFWTPLGWFPSFRVNSSWFSFLITSFSL